MQDNYQDLKTQPQQIQPPQQPSQPQPQFLNEQIYSQQRIADPQFYQQQVPYLPKDNFVAPAASASSWFDFSNPSYLKGFVIASGITLVAANPSVQQALIKGGLKIWTFFQGGVEEIKEQVQDVRAEMSQK